MNSDECETMTKTDRIDLLKHAVNSDLKLTDQEKQEVCSHLESGKYEMREAVVTFLKKLDLVMQGPSTYERGQKIAQLTITLEKKCGLR